MYKRKTKDVWVLYQDYGYGDGWEYVIEEDTLDEIKKRKKEYLENQPQYPLKVKRERRRLES